MPLWLLIVLVVGGISGVAWVCHRLGLTDGPPLDASSAAQAWLRHFPDDAVQQLTLARNGRAAMVETRNGRGLVWRFGADTVARHLKHAELNETADGLHLRFDEFGAPGLRIALTPEERAIWRQWIEAA